MASAGNPEEPTLVPDTAGLHVGDVLAGRYSVQRVIGKGGMATIVEALHLELGSRVAIKVLHAMHESDESIERFLREARAIFPLRSENVCRVLDLGRLPSGAPFIAMEYLEGKDFASEFKNKKCDPGIAADYIVQACKGLAEAHALGIVHRDIKPANLFLVRRSDGSDLVKVLDFGISKLETAQDESLTADGQIMGTPRYMAPEQFGGAAQADARADVWALGLVLYKLLAGQLPYTAISISDIYAELMNRDPADIRKAVPGIDEELAAIVMRCLSRNAKKRFPNARALGAALEPLARAATGDTQRVIEPENPTASIIDATPPRTSISKNRALIAGGVAGLVAIVGVIAFVFVRADHHVATVPAGTASVAAAPSAAASESAPPVAASATVTVAPSASATPTTTTATTHAPTVHAPNCAPPYYFDTQHRKIFKKECM